ncbi:MAG: asparagine synthase B [Myxococcota bacterium]|nr:asparagine synthase B [Myxococcota bacterium]
MCGIVCVYGDEISNQPSIRDVVLRQQRRLRHRGPDWSGIHVHPRCILAHERLAIVDPQSGKQPLKSEDQRIVLSANGEIYNHRELRNRFSSYPFQTGSDCEVILALYENDPHNFVRALDGAFAFVISDARNGHITAVRDHMGIVPLYYGSDRDGNIWFASEMKALNDIVSQVRVFPPGHLYRSETDSIEQWYKPDWHGANVPVRPASTQRLRTVLEEAVRKRMMSDVPWGVLLSGGLDSSLVASIATKFAAKRIESDHTEKAWWPRVHSFCIGLTGSPDLAAARRVADFLGTVHHEFVFTFQEGLDAISDVIYHLETYDVTTIRASTPMYLMSRCIKAMGIKMVLSGEGADEIFGGYLYFHKAPNADEFHHETVRKLKTLHLYDCLRANKSTSAWGVEVRVPFLDKSVLQEAMTIDPTAKMSSSHPDGARMEKHILRSSFEDSETPYLPKEILWRQKEQFSDGVGYSWIDGLKDHAEAQVSDDMLIRASDRFPINTPTTKEAYFFRSIFHQHFPGDDHAKTVPGGPSIACSTAKAIEWDENFSKSADPSGRAVGVHQSAYSDR